MNKFIKRIGSAIAIAFGCAVLVGGDYRAYASQREEHDSAQYDEVFLNAVQKVFEINSEGRIKEIGAGNILWFLDTSTQQIIMLYSKQQHRNAQALAKHIQDTTKKDVQVYSLEDALRLDENWSEESLCDLFKCAGQILFDKGKGLFGDFEFSLFNRQNYNQYRQRDIRDEDLRVVIQENLDLKQVKPDEWWKIFINYLSHTEPIFLVLVERRIFNPDTNVGVYSILNPCNSCKWLFDKSTTLNCTNRFMGTHAERIFFRYLAIDGQHRKKESKDWGVRWHTWCQTEYNGRYSYGNNDIEDKPR